MTPLLLPSDLSSIDEPQVQSFSELAPGQCPIIAVAASGILWESNNPPAEFSDCSNRINIEYCMQTKIEIDIQFRLLGLLRARWPPFPAPEPALSAMPNLQVSWVLLRDSQIVLRQDAGTREANGTDCHSDLCKRLKVIWCNASQRGGIEWLSLGANEWKVPGSVSFPNPMKCYCLVHSTSQAMFKDKLQSAPCLQERQTAAPPGSRL